jgi:hypothetical protein
MKPLTTTRRRVARDVARAGAAVSAAMLVLTVVAALGSTEPHASAAGTNAGALTLVDPVSKAVLAAGTATTAFQINPPNGAACTGDTATAGYRVNSYIVPASVDPSTLTWDSSGPVPVGQGATLRQPLFSTTQSPLRTFATAPTTAIINAALGGTYDFSTFQAAGGTAFVPDGAYNVGVSCTLNGVEDKFWNVVLDFKASGTNLAFTVRAAGTTPTTTTTTTTTTVRPGGTTTTTSSTTTTTVRSTSTTSTTVVLSNAGGVGGGGSNLLVSTGSSPTRLLMWAVLLLAFGRMAILLGRPIKVITARQ